MSSLPIQKSTVEVLGDIRSVVGAVVRGKEDVVESILVALLAKGHVLLEDVPGVGKTTLATAFARALGVSFSRVQFTSDLLPSDILGVTTFEPTQQTFTFRPGPIFSNLVLADEINRTTPRTQSALLEAMSEGAINIDGKSHELPAPFFVLATQNPLDNYGTYPLPESQMDRFLVRLSVGYPSQNVERELLIARTNDNAVETIKAAISSERFREILSEVESVTLNEVVAGYISDVVQATRTDENIKIGVSTRGALAMGRACRARALLRGRTFVTPEDAQALFIPVFAHRIAFASALDRSGEEALIARIVSGIPIPV